ncbi:MAG: hypothetical protein WDW38_004874 [Sanguina aurantia]
MWGIYVGKQQQQRQQQRQQRQRQRTAETRGIAAAGRPGGPALKSVALRCALLRCDPAAAWATRRDTSTALLDAPRASLHSTG